MKVICVIPARYASTRLPGKPLLDICGKPLIQRVWEVVSEARGMDEVIVATDDARIASCVEGFGGRVCMTSPDCASGSDRVREVAESVPADVYINVQGDEPLLEPAAIERLAAVFREDASVQAATLCSRISPEQGASPNQVKVVCAGNGDALYFSRAVIPFARDAGTEVTYLGHIGIYAYRAEVLKRFASLPPSPLELVEKLEQLRLLQAGIPLRVLEVPPMGPGVDTPEDLERVRAVFLKRREAAALEKLKQIRLVVTDVDGVLTDGGLFYGAEGEVLKRFHARDGLGVKLLQKAGIQVAVLSGRDCPALRRRLADLGITEAVLGRLDKKDALAGIMERCGVSAEETTFLGDDLPDAEAFACCGLGVCVSDAPEYIKTKADLVLKTKGGQGAFRELVDILLDIREAHRNQI